MPSNEEELLAQTGNSMEIEYFPPFDGSIFSEDVYGETNELGMPTHELPDILPVCSTSPGNVTGGSYFILVGNGGKAVTVSVAGVYDGLLYRRCLDEHGLNARRSGAVDRRTVALIYKGEF